MIDRVLSWVWLHLGPFQRLALWILNDTFMVGVGAVLVNDQGHVWLQKHRFWPNQAWGLAGGHAQHGESAEAVVRREVMEETGLTLGALSLLHVDMSHDREHVIYFVGNMAGGELKLDQREVLAADFFPLNDLPSPILPAHARILNLYKEQISEVAHGRKDKAS